MSRSVGDEVTRMVDTQNELEVRVSSATGRSWMLCAVW